MALEVWRATTPHAAMLWLHWAGEGALEAPVERNGDGERRALGLVHASSVKAHRVRLREAGLVIEGKTRTFPSRSTIMCRSPEEALTYLTRDAGVRRRRRYSEGSPGLVRPGPQKAILQRFAELGLADVAL